MSVIDILILLIVIFSVIGLVTIIIAFKLDRDRLKNNPKSYGPYWGP